MTHEELVKQLESLQAQLMALIIKVKKEGQPLSGGGPGEEK
jgi:ribosomal protein L29